MIINSNIVRTFGETKWNYLLFKIMKQLFINGSATTLFFSEKASFDDIFEWIQEKVMFSTENLFNLNEQHSCSVHSCSVCNGNNAMCTIEGDEDLKIITIENITPLI